MRIISKNGSRTIIVGKGESMTMMNGKTYINGEEVNLDELANQQNFAKCSRSKDTLEN